jgi:hypothetical protein
MCSGIVLTNFIELLLTVQVVQHAAHRARVKTIIVALERVRVNSRIGVVGVRRIRRGARFCVGSSTSNTRVHTTKVAPAGTG